jgi:hypothetical protein
LDLDLGPDSDISITKNHNKKKPGFLLLGDFSFLVFFDPETDFDLNLNPNLDIYF